MSDFHRALARCFLPLAVFTGVVTAHVVWLGLFPEAAQAEKWCAGGCADEGVSWLGAYIDAQDYWLGLSYGVSLAFAAVALRRYRERRLCAARNLAIGGMSLSGVLAVAGCYLLGCCGSPMLAVYVSLFGTAFLPFTKPLVAGLTIAIVLAAWWWMRRAERRAAAAPKTEEPGAECECRG